MILDRFKSKRGTTNVCTDAPCICVCTYIMTNNDIKISATILIMLNKRERPTSRAFKYYKIKM